MSEAIAGGPIYFVVQLRHGAETVELNEFLPDAYEYAFRLDDTPLGQAWLRKARDQQQGGLAGMLDTYRRLKAAGQLPPSNVRRAPLRRAG